MTFSGNRTGATWSGTLPRPRPGIRLGPFSAVRRPAVAATALALLGVLALLVCIDIARGEFVIPLGDVIDTLSGGGSRSQRFVIFDSRLPRTATAVVAGAALGMAGAITQSVLRNPLAGPDLLGITSGASFAATAAVVGIGGELAGPLGVSGAALVGGLATGAAIYLLSWHGGVDGFRLVLIGIGINAALVAGVGWLLVSARIEDVARAQIWLNGSLADTSWARFGPTAIGCGVTFLVALGAARNLGALRFGADTAGSLGVRAQLQQSVLLLAAVVAAASATAAVGPVVFIALAAPQIARRLLRVAGEPLLGSAALGAALLVGSDVIGRTLLPVSLPVGVVSAAFGGPFLLYLLVRTNRKASA